ncbi:LOW QUALITY PROTEIN: hypothetical protein T265_15330 [Opisthorchis viverrini]|uniref:Oxidoreductase, short chain dehydrogenase/reductase family protein n=1 Tax=Opisthorchis viverrini TaxID=6198 RepID=A0A074ZYX0_OPIVI|nr:LOW QUALITY PROTEIN: hypothetical protein T265_15330 [Opisthorchis viverrini]KER20389.1 LOW QUALITY PROTEIN: hypothetical protein T265_15330 [Opisthorchis viverrini]
MKFLNTYHSRSCFCNVPEHSSAFAELRMSWILLIGTVFCLVLLWKLYTYITTHAECQLPHRLDGQLAIVTGCNQGIGLELVGELSRRGARVIMACRDLGRAEAGRQQLLYRFGKCVNVESSKPYQSPITEEQVSLFISTETTRVTYSKFLFCSNIAEQSRSAVTRFLCLAVMLSEGNARAEMLPGCPSLDRGSLEAEVEFEPWTFRSVYSRSNHQSTSPRFAQGHSDEHYCFRDLASTYLMVKIGAKNEICCEDWLVKFKTWRHERLVVCGPTSHRAGCYETL